MEKPLFDEMLHNVELIDQGIDLASKKIFLFGHCNATLELIDLLEKKGLKTTAILDNSAAKQGQEYKGAVVVLPNRILTMAGKKPEADSVVLITSRFYASMLQQLRKLGYEGPVRKVIDYNTYAEYSLSEDTITRMKARERHGEELLGELSHRYNKHFKVFCPFSALGDIYFMISYWPAYAKKRSIDYAVFCVLNNALVDVIHMFGDYLVEVYDQKELDSMIQSAIYTQDKDSYIAHQDRPYVINLHRALYIKKISLEQMYCCGVFGLPIDTVPEIPKYGMGEYKNLDCIVEGKSVIFSPYAKSVTAIDADIWKDAVDYYNGEGYKCFTNVVGDEAPLDRTEALEVPLLEMISVLEKAGTFIGIRSGLCDVVRTANCKKIALYPDYNYCDTKWKAIDIYSIKGFDNIAVNEGDTWETIKHRIQL